MSAQQKLGCLCDVPSWKVQFTALQQSNKSTRLEHINLNTDGMHSARTLVSKCKERITAFIPSTTRNATCHTFGDHPLQSSPLKYSTPLPVPFFITLLHSQVLRVCQSWVCYDHTMRHRNKGRTSHSHNMTHMFWLLFQSCGGYIRNRDTVQ